MIKSPESFDSGDFVARKPGISYSIRCGGDQLLINLLKKYRTEIILAIIITTAYFLTRLINLTLIPIFTDEAIYLRWAQIAWHDSAWRFISLVDGKQPLLIWLAIPFMKMISDPLLAGRLVSVFAGFGTMIGLFLVTHELFRNRKTAFLAAIFYLLSPFGLFYDRLALYDSLVVTLCVFSLFFEIRLAKNPRLDTALLLGMVMGLGLLNKSSAFFSIYLLPFSLILFSWKPTPSVIVSPERLPREKLRDNQRAWQPRLSMNLPIFIKWLLLVSLSVLLALIYYNILRLSPLFHMVNIKNQLFVMPLGEFIKSPFVSLHGNLNALIDWFTSYLTLPIVLTLIIALIYGLKKHLRETSLIFLWFLIPFLALASFGRVLYPRFILFMVVPLFIILANFLSYVVEKLRNKKYPPAMRFAPYGICFLLFAFPVYFILCLLISPLNAPLPLADRGQFVNDWPAGYGVKESIAFFKQEMQKEKIFVATEGTFGLMPYSFELYLVDNPKIQIKAYWPVNEFPKEVTQIAKTMPTYFVFNEKQDIQNNWPIKLVAKYRKGNGEKFMRLYKVIP